MRLAVQAFGKVDQGERWGVFGLTSKGMFDPPCRAGINRTARSECERSPSVGKPSRPRRVCWPGLPPALGGLPPTFDPRLYACSQFCTRGAIGPFWRMDSESHSDLARGWPGVSLPKPGLSSGICPAGLGMCHGKTARRGGHRGGDLRSCLYRALRIRKTVRGNAGPHSPDRYAQPGIESETRVAASKPRGERNGKTQMEHVGPEGARRSASVGRLRVQCKAARAASCRGGQSHPLAREGSMKRRDEEETIRVGRLGGDGLRNRIPAVEVVLGNPALSHGDSGR